MTKEEQQILYPRRAEPSKGKTDAKPGRNSDAVGFTADPTADEKGRPRDEVGMPIPPVAREDEEDDENDPAQVRLKTGQRK